MGLPNETSWQEIVDTLTATVKVENTQNMPEDQGRIIKEIEIPKGASFEQTVAILEEDANQSWDYRQMIDTPGKEIFALGPRLMQRIAIMQDIVKQHEKNPFGL